MNIFPTERYCFVDLYHCGFWMKYMSVEVEVSSLRLIHTMLIKDVTELCKDGG